ncbi:MAG: BRO family protein [Neisseria sp.]|nr:BRO family protein [Neisseria sp.]
MNAILSFNNVHFDISDINGKTWLRLPQIGAALGYANPYKIQQVYNRNADEFTDNMTQVIELPTQGGIQSVRVFSLRGCHLLGMLARTKIAKEFRSWVLDILERETDNQPTEPRLSDKQVGYLYQSVMRICAETGQPYQTVFGGLKRHFGVASYKHLAPKDFQAACAWLGVTVKTFEGEVIDAPDNWESCRHNVQSTLNAAEWVCYWFTHHYPALKLLNPHAASFIIDHVKDMKLGIGLIRSRMNWQGVNRQHMEYFPWNGSNEQQQHYHFKHLA